MILRTIKFLVLFAVLVSIPFDAVLPAGASSPSHLLTRLVSYWKLDEASSDAIDACGSNTLAPNGSPASAPGIVNGARTFSGDHQYFSLPTNSDFETGAIDFTFTAWVSMTNKLDHHNFIGKQVELPAAIRDYSLYYDVNFDRFIFQVAGSDGVTLTRAMANSLGSPASNTWYFLAGGYDYASSQIWIRVNNGSKEYVGFSGAVHEGPAPFMIGSVDNPNIGYHAGQLDEIGFWKRTLTDNELDTLYNAGQGFSFPFNEGGCQRTYLPFVAKSPATGLYGFVTDDGLPADGVDLELRYYDGSTWSTRATTSTAADGKYLFQDVPSLLPGEYYYGRYVNPNSSTSNRLLTWHTQTLSTYRIGTNFNLGNFDLADVVGQSPSSGQALTLPYTFTWTKRPATPSDSYELEIFDLDNDPYFSTPQLGYADSHALGAMPTGFSPNETYYWDIQVHSPDGGFGASFSLYAFTFANAAAAHRDGESPTTGRVLP